jgi:hypothetical protein
VILGYIDLSKRRVAAEDIVKCEEKFNKSKAVHSIMRHVSEKCEVPLQDLYEQFGWPLYKKYGHAFEAFKLAISYVFPLTLPYRFSLSCSVSLVLTLFALVFSTLHVAPLQLGIQIKFSKGLRSKTTFTKN